MAALVNSTSTCLPLGRRRKAPHQHTPDLKLLEEVSVAFAGGQCPSVLDDMLLLGSKGPVAGGHGSRASDLRKPVVYFTGATSWSSPQHSHLALTYEYPSASGNNTPCLGKPSVLGHKNPWLSRQTPNIERNDELLSPEKEPVSVQTTLKASTILVWS